MSRPGCEAAGAAEVVRAYHQRTKHHLDRYAAGPGSLDWDAQPDPFRAWSGARTLPLPRRALEIDTPWDALLQPRPAAAFDLQSLGALLQLTAAITAWKAYGGSRWALRANPSSGNLHPTETYVIASGVAGLEDGLYHYGSRRHELALRAGLAARAGPGLWLGFSSIHWREAWKYGERAFRYCQLDLGHALGALGYAVALLGWKAGLLPLPTGAVAACLGLDRAGDFAGVEPEEAEALLALTPADPAALPAEPPPSGPEWYGRPNLLDPRPMHRWPVIDEVAEASRGAPPARASAVNRTAALPAAVMPAVASAVIHARRSAQAFDGRSVMPLAHLHRLLACLLPGNAPPWRLWPFAPRVHPVLLVHRVEGLAPGVYALPRSGDGEAGLRACMRAEFEWQRADPELPLFQLVAADAMKVGRTLACHQNIAGDCAVAFMLVAEFGPAIDAAPAAYRHLHWEAGLLGHVIALEAEAAGWRATGIGCFFDDSGHEVLGIRGDRFQTLYHFAVGRQLDDPRLTTLPAYDSAR
jgi:SagB-type dehydrogenase family enzyme